MAHRCEGSHRAKPLKLHSFSPSGGALPKPVVSLGFYLRSKITAPRLRPVRSPADRGKAAAELRRSSPRQLCNLAEWLARPLAQLPLFPRCGGWPEPPRSITQCVDDHRGCHQPPRSITQCVDDHRRSLDLWRSLTQCVDDHQRSPCT